MEEMINRSLKPTESLQLPPKPVKVLIAGGGTGGHVVPAIAIGEALKRRNADSTITFLGSDRGIERDLIPKGYELIELGAKPFPRGFGLGYVRAGWELAKAVNASSKIIRRLEPDVVVGTGGYVSVAAVIAARMNRKPILLQEQNSIPGRANRFLARWADQIHIHFTEARRHFKDKSKLRLSGNPVRVRYPEGRGLKTLDKFRLHHDRRTVVILGGSQGARSLNEAFQEALPHFKDDPHLQFVIQTGKGGYRPTLNAVRNSGVRVVVKSFLNNIEEIYGIADLVVARAGAMTVSELAACGVPSILVPYPHAADDHQTANAQALADKDAAIMVPDHELNGERLAKEIRRVLDDEMLLRRMGTHAYRLSRPDAARHIAESVEVLAGAAPEAVLNLPEDYDGELPELAEAGVESK